eukprot:SAG31_NODE_18687_length_626_cov_1.846300_1_plen_25_part_10
MHRNTLTPDLSRRAAFVDKLKEAVA